MLCKMEICACGKSINDAIELGSNLERLRLRREQVATDQGQVLRRVIKIDAIE